VGRSFFRVKHKRAYHSYGKGTFKADRRVIERQREAMKGKPPTEPQLAELRRLGVPEDRLPKTFLAAYSRLRRLKRGLRRDGA
jgi:hypothetical protein